MNDREEATLKRFKRQNQYEVELILENIDMDVMIYAANRDNIHGVLVGQMCNFR